MAIMRRGLTYDDVLLQPKKSSVDSRSDIDISITLNGGIDLDIPVISSPMDTVTGPGMAQAMHEAGGVGVIHRFCDADTQADMVRQVNGAVGGAVGIFEYERARKLINAGVSFICVDVAHAHSENCLETISEIDVDYDIPIMAGTVATRVGAKDLASAGADMVRVGVGSGSSCTTREKAGVGIPQITAIRDACRNPYDVSIIADGGIKKPGDIVKALMAGSDAVVLGGLLSACEESLAPIVKKDGESYKRYRGMASRDAQKDYRGSENIYVEGDSYLCPLDGTVEEKLQSFENGIRSGLSYCGGSNIREARENAEFIEITSNTVRRNGVHTN